MEHDTVECEISRRNKYGANSIEGAEAQENNTNSTGNDSEQQTLQSIKNFLTLLG